MSYKGWAGTILRINLSTGTVRKENLKRDLATKYIGGRGFNSKILYDETGPDTDPLGPENRLVFGVGPCNGTILCGSQRITVSAKSPLSGFLGDGNGGGKLGVEIKYAGYDAIVIEGKASSPSYIYVEDDAVEIRSADHLWGRPISETRRELEREFGKSDLALAAIGKGGENLVKIACIMVDIGSSASRSGIGAVMGSKNLKALVVIGNKGVQVFDQRGVEEFVQKAYEAYREDARSQREKEIGTIAGAGLYQKAGCLPTYNYRDGQFDAFDRVSPDRLKETYRAASKSCFSCGRGCDWLYVVEEGPFAGTYGSGFELGHIEHLATRLGCADLSLACHLANLCNDYGLDVLDLGGLIGFAMECSEAGILGSEDAGGLKMTWGDEETILELTEMIASRRGLGDILAEGLKKAPELIGKGSEKFAMHVKGLSISTNDPRGAKGRALGYAVSSRGACHCRGFIPYENQDGWIQETVDVIFGEKGHKVPNRFSEKDKPELLAFYENVSSILHSLELCLFSNLVPEVQLPSRLVKLIKAVTGVEMNERELLRAGERLINLERAYNIREGLSRADDTLPDRFTKEPLKEGETRGHVVNLETMLDRYYEVRGWDRASGFPSKTKLKELGLEEVAEELVSMGKDLPD